MNDLPVVKRDGWGEGPWDQEPDFEKWIYEGYHCKVIRMHRTGSWCGYVRIPGGHPLYLIQYNDDVSPKLAEHVERVKAGLVGKRGVLDLFCVMAGGGFMNGMLFNVHGGITYSRWEEDSFWYGFDCGHCDDFQPGTYAMLKDFRLKHPEFNDEPRGIYRTMAYARSECISLVEQLRALE